MHASRPQFSLVAFALVLCAGSAARATEPLFSNHGPAPAEPALATGGSTASGTPAPPGFVWSEVPSVSSTEANGLIGLSIHAHAGEAFRFADDFVVPPGEKWRLDALTLYAYQTGAPLPPGASPFASVNIRVWRQSPASDQAELLFGNTTTNRLLSATGSGVLRAMNSVVTPIGGLPDTSRHVWRIDAALGAPGGDDSFTLSAGTYWIDFQLTTIDPNGAAFMPPATLAGVRAIPGANGLHQRLAGTWQAAIDSGKPDSASDAPLDAPFIVHGVILCPADFNFDGTVDPDDLSDYIAGYFATPPNPRCDGNADGTIDPDDLSDYIAAFFSAC